MLCRFNNIEVYSSARHPFMTLLWIEQSTPGTKNYILQVKKL